MTTRIKSIKAGPEIIEVLKLGVFSTEGLSFPQLPPEKYQKIKKYLNLIQATWDKKKQVHVLKNGAREDLQSLINGETVIDEKKTYECFYTPGGLAREMAELLDLESGMIVLEPSAGEGALARAARDKGADTICIEIRPEACQILERDGFTVLQGDFFDFPNYETARTQAMALGAPEPEERLFDAVIMNPPFFQCEKHVLHALDFLKIGARLLSIMPRSILYGEKEDQKRLREVFNIHGRVVREVEAGAFKASGTEIATLLLEITR